jgi:hypothetical protein
MKKAIIFLFFIAASIWAQDRPYRVLVAYTDSVSRVWADPITEIDNMIAHSNLIYDNSQIGQIRAEGVCIHRVNYAESGYCGTDLDNFRFDAPHDYLMNEIFGLRTQYQADICALICAFFTDYTGASPGAYMTAGNAFFDMVISCAGIHVFAHEAGHIAGCRHCINAGCSNHDQTNIPVAYCHAKHQPSNLADGWRTVMSNPWLYSTHVGWVIEEFANPNLSYNGQPLGTVTDENTSLLMIQRIEGDPVADPYGIGSFANFQATPASLTVNEAIPAQDGRLARATSTINITNGFTVNQGARFTATLDPAPFGKRRSDDGKPAVKNQVGIEKTDFKVRLTGNNLVLDYKLTEKAEIILKICNAAGRLVHAAKLGVRQPGIYNQSLQFPMAAGSYYVNILAGSYQSPKMFIKK